MDIKQKYPHKISLKTHLPRTIINHLKLKELLYHLGADQITSANTPTILQQQIELRKHLSRTYN